ncbi:MAG TPA: hypothetical protein VHC22_06240 [Pirellulales bacterium]|nr:hypothetical protein [Pirellulales bacterium]
MQSTRNLLVRAAVVLVLAGCNRGPNTVPAVSQTSPAAETPEQAPADNAIGAPSDSPSPPLSEPVEPSTAATPPPADVPQESSETEGDAGGSTTADRQAADDLSSERLALFLPEGMLIVELRMTIDGQPYRSAREELVDDALKRADHDGDGRATWDEVFTDPKRTFLQRYDLSTRDVNRKEFMKTYDTNQNGLIDRGEARRIVARAKSAGEAFSLDGSTQYRHANQRESIVRTMLDTNEDEVLDGAELDAAEQRLFARDANDDHIVSWTELDDSLAGDEQAMNMRQYAYLNQPAAFRLGARADWDGIVYALSERYLSGNRLDENAPPLIASLAAKLDADHDGQFTYEEFRGLDRIEPHLVLAANFGQVGDLLAGLSLVRLADELGPADEVVSHAPHGLVLKLADSRLRIVLDDRQPAGEPSAEAQFNSFDKDKNGYLDKEEVEGAAPDVAKLFDEADENADAKVFLNEFLAFRRRQQPQSSAVHALAEDDQDVLFPLLDANQDGRLTARELQAARQALMVLDTDGDGRLGLDELPGGMTLSIGRGTANMSMRRVMAMADMPAENSQGPAWFVQMDANRDHEVSLDEFPGTGDKFRKLDLDGDGFLSASEAQASATH